MSETIFDGDAEGQDTEPEPEIQSEPEPESDLIFGKFRDLEAAQNGYRNAERKIHEQGAELNTLRAQIAEYEAALEAQQFDETYGWEDTQPMDTAAQMAALVQAANLAVDQRFGTAPQAPTADQVISLADQQVEQIVGREDWETWREPAAEVIAADPRYVAYTDQALRAGDSGALGAMWLQAVNQAKTQAASELHQQASTRFKEQSQSLSGTGSRIPPATDEAAAWAKIVSAGDDYASRRQRSGA